MRKFNRIGLSAYFCKLFTHYVVTARAIVYFIPARLQTKATDASAGEGGQQHTPHPRSCSHLTTHPGNWHVPALWTAYFDRIIWVASIRWVFSYHVLLCFDRGRRWLQLHYRGGFDGWVVFIFGRLSGTAHALEANIMDFEVHPLLLISLSQMHHFCLCATRFFGVAGGGGLEFYFCLFLSSIRRCSYCYSSLRRISRSWFF